MKGETMKAITSKNLMLLIAASLIITGSAFAQQPGMHPGERGEQRMPKREHSQPMPMIPDLTERQKEQIKELRTAHMKVVLPLKNQLAEKRAQLRTVSTAESVDMRMVNKLIEEMGAIKTQMMKERAAHYQEIRKLLTESQRLFLDAHPHPRPHAHGFDKPMP
jgi:Spy/CpxP family protein refolding chaperone